MPLRRVVACRRYAAVIGVSFMVVEVGCVSRRFAAAIGLSFMVVEVGGVNRRYAAAIGRWVIIPEGSGRTPPLRGGYWSIFYGC